MSRYIEADALKANCYIMVGDVTIGQRDYVMFHEIDSAPSIDIVFCKECKYKDTEFCAMYKLVVAGVRKYDDFCSYGESKE